MGRFSIALRAGFVAVALFSIPNPVLARFLQTDPVGYSDDLDVYIYVQNDPTDKADPTGRQSEGIMQSYMDAQSDVLMAQQGVSFSQIREFDQIKAQAEVEAGMTAVGIYAAAPTALEMAEFDVTALARQAVTRWGAGTASRVARGLTGSQRTSASKIASILRNNGLAKDFAGVAKELAGKLAGTGHIKEMQQSVKALSGALKSIQGSLENPNLAAAERASLEKVSPTGQTVLDMMKRALAGK